MQVLGLAAGACCRWVLAACRGGSIDCLLPGEWVLIGYVYSESVCSVGVPLPAASGSVMGACLLLGVGCPLPTGAGVWGW